MVQTVFILGVDENGKDVSLKVNADGTIDTNVVNTGLETSDLRLQNKMNELIVQMKINNKILMECFEIEIEDIDVE